MVFTRKFSEFVAEPVTSPVGLTSGANSIGPTSGSGVVVATITQPNDFAVGDWVECIAGIYQRAQADNAMDAEVIGVVQSIITMGSVFVLQQSGYITTLGAITPLIPSIPYFLDPDFAGQMTQTEPFVNGEVSRPVLIADSPTTAWVLPYRGYVIGGGAPINPGTGLITQIITEINHGFVLGDWIRTDGFDITKPYVKSLSDNLADAQAIGVVIDVPDVNHFKVQVDGYVANHVFLLAGEPLAVGGIYYLSETLPGKMTLTVPVAIGQATKPVFSADSNATGWILPQRPLTIANNGGGGTGVTLTVTQTNDFVIGDWLRLDETSPLALYVRAKADTPQNAEVIGVVQDIIVPNLTFVIQQSGYLTTFTGKIPGARYFLDDAVAGAMTIVEPVTNGHVSRPVFIPQNASNGWVLPYRGYVIGGGAPVNPGGGIVTRIVTQIGHGFLVGEWLRNSTPIEASTPYMRAQADTLKNSQAVGVVIEVLDANNFILQETGYVGIGVVTAAAGVIFYLSPTVAGAMQPTAPTTPGQFTKPVFSGESGTTGWILPQRPLEVTTAGNNPVIQVITQTGHGFMVGQWLRTQSTSLSPYTKAIADNLPDSWVVGLVIDVIDADHFILQQSGFISGIFGSTLSQGTIYYLSTTVLGGQQNTAPGTLGQSNRPVFSADGVDSGWILPHRPDLIESNADTSIITVHQVGHGFTVGQFIATTTANDTYVLAIADTMTHAYKGTGFVIAVVGPDDFVLQQSGFCSSFVSLPLPFPPLAAGKSYWLSPTLAGQIQVVEPIGLTAVSRPVLNATDTTSGWILPQRPVLNASGISPPSGGGWVLIQTAAIVKNVFFNFTGGFKNYVVVWNDLLVSSNAVQPGLRFYNGSTPYVNNYNVSVTGAGGGVFYPGYYYISLTTQGSLNVNSYTNGSGTLWIMNPLAPNSVNNYRVSCQGQCNSWGNGSGLMITNSIGGQLAVTGAPATGIGFITFLNGGTVSGTWSLYGISS